MIMFSQYRRNVVLSLMTVATILLQQRHTTAAGEVTFRLDNVILNRDATEMVLSDLNGDGQKDLILIGGTSDEDVYAMINQGNFESFGPPYLLLGPKGRWLSDARDIAVMDGNQDGHDDIIVCYFGNPEYDIQTSEGSILVARNSGDGTFNILDPLLTSEQLVGPTVTMSKTYCRDITVADMNNDGADDIVATVHEGGPGDPSMLVYIENAADGTGNFKPPQVIADDFELGGGTALNKVADMDNDGLFDIVVLSERAQLLNIFYQATDGSFAVDTIDFATPFVGVGEQIVVGDLTGNGLNDIVNYAGFGYGANVYVNNGNRQFVKEELLESEDQGWGSSGYLQAVIYDVGAEQLWFDFC